MNDYSHVCTLTFRQGFYYFEAYLRGREELLLQVYNDFKPNSNGIITTQPNSLPLAKARTSNVLSPRTQRTLKHFSGRKLPLPVNPIDSELEKDESRASFLIAGYPRYKCPYVWLRSNHKRLIQNESNQKVDTNDPLKLSTISAWRTDVYADIKYLQKSHFILYEELHSFLTEHAAEENARKNGVAAQVEALNVSPAH
ncbi:hypothetical protein BGZ73_006591 [Actinomortierella ambigua]|nr:hypothetical protein BGZ73_006591 [Actinomortierella ambigua]